jgi:hypothetical protein
MDQLQAYAWAAAAVIAVVSWAAWQRGALGAIGRSALLLLAVAATVVASALFLQGQRMRWTSEGPGIVLVMLGFAVSSVIALSLWAVAVKAFLGRRQSSRPSEDAGQATRRPRVASPAVLGAVLLVCAVSGGAAWFRAARDKPAHDAAVAAVRFIDGKDRAASIDIDGVLKLWELTSPLPQGNQRSSPYSMKAKIEVPGGRGARNMWVEAGGRHIAMLGQSGITLVEIDRMHGQSHALYTVEGATLAVPAHGSGFVVVAPNGLAWIGPASPQPTAAAVWDAKVVALDASARGPVAFADARGRVALVEHPSRDVRLLGTVPFAVDAMAFSADGSGLLVLGPEGKALAFAVADGSSRVAQMAHGPTARPLQGSIVLACSGQATSCTGVNTTDGRSFAAFSGIVRSYDRLDAAPGAVLIASGNDLVVVSMPGPSYHAGSAVLKDPRF